MCCEVIADLNMLHGQYGREKCAENDMTLKLPKEVYCVFV